jgi:hypothetical protein
LSGIYPRPFPLFEKGSSTEFVALIIYRMSIVGDLLHCVQMNAKLWVLQSVMTSEVLLIQDLCI